MLPWLHLCTPKDIVESLMPMPEAIVHSQASPEVGASSPPFNGLAYSAPGACQRSGRNLSGSSKFRQVLWIACACPAQTSIHALDKTSGNAFNAHVSFELVPACRQLDTSAQQPVYVKDGAKVSMHACEKAGLHGVRTGKKTVVRAGMMYFPASMTSFLGARTVPPATGYILSASCTHQRSTESYAST